MQHRCYCSLTFQGKELDVLALREYIKTTNLEGVINPFDLETILPIPTELYIEINDNAYLMYKQNYRNQKLTEIETRKLNALNFNDYVKAMKIAENYQDNVKKFGVTTWKEWAFLNWNTTTPPVCEQEDNSNMYNLLFFTIYAPPLYPIELLSQKFPKVKLLLDYSFTKSNTKLYHAYYYKGNLFSFLTP